MEKVVVDTSVIVKWFIEEPKSKDALELLDLHKKNKISLLVPEIIIVELLNALYYSNNYNVKELKRDLENLTNMRVLGSIPFIDDMSDTSLYRVFKKNIDFKSLLS